jgi:hypothetical protein
VCYLVLTAFGSDGLLIGVAGIDVVTDDLDERLKASVFREIAWRKTGTLDAPANINLTCSYQVSLVGSTISIQSQELCFGLSTLHRSKGNLSF